MSGDFLFWLTLLLLLLIINLGAYYLKKNKEVHIMWSGILISIFAPIMAFFIGAVFLKIDKSTGGDGFGAGIAAAVLGWIILLNGILYFIIGSVLKIITALKKK